jgi:GNAT superfamily N-acetyltransferase
VGGSGTSSATTYDTIRAVSKFTVRPATIDDAERIIELMHELAVFEKLDHIFVNTAAELKQWLFSGSPVASAYVAEMNSEVIGYAVVFRSFSTFLGRPGVWLEDLYVTPAMRGSGVGKALLRHVASSVVENGYGRLEWSVLDWNQNAIDFYEYIGAEILQEWRVCRLTGEKLEQFAALQVTTF